MADESPEKTGDVAAIKAHKLEGLNLQGITFLKPKFFQFYLIFQINKKKKKKRLIELIIEIYFKNPVKMTIYDSSSKKIESYIEKEIRRLNEMNFKQTDVAHKYLFYFFGSFVPFVVHYFNTLDNKDFLESDNSDDQGNIFRFLANTIKQLRVHFKNKLSESQTMNLKKLFEIAKIEEEDDEGYFKTTIFHLMGSGEFIDFPKETNEEFDDIIKEVESEKKNEFENEAAGLFDLKSRMIGSVKRGRGMSELKPKNDNHQTWRIFKKELISSEILQNVKKKIYVMFLG